MADREKPTLYLTVFISSFLYLAGEKERQSPSAIKNSRKIKESLRYVGRQVAVTALVNLLPLASQM
ncbi:hypothetical protein E2C01_079486 [Portunus trituberculatus]|uniref:Uncharacterized protein n=1 Tax=Portunus trituberculatus TaxID=210409 RepID=A0A5B7ITG9_PORTR|nr:hypothetical protein [Portunus trituberculatus]